jgi:hypothetical protein
MLYVGEECVLGGWTMGAVGVFFCVKAMCVDVDV